MLIPGGKAKRPLAGGPGAALARWFFALRWAKAGDNSLAAAGANQKAVMPGHNGSSLIQGVLEHFAGTEFENFAGGNGQRIAGTRVAPLASLAGFYRKGAKTREGQFGLFYKSVFHRSKKSIEGTLGGSLGQVCLGGDFFNQISFSHQHILLKIPRLELFCQQAQAANAAKHYVLKDSA